MATVRSKAKKVIKKLVTSKKYRKEFKENPSAVIKEILGVEVGEEQLDKILAIIGKKVDLSLLDSDGDGKPDVGFLGKLFKNRKTDSDED